MRQVMKLLEVRVEAAESEEEGMEIRLLDRIRNTPATTAWGNFSGRGHPTFHDIQGNLISSSTSMSDSDIIKEGR
ncbi:hypothetical protein COLO4_36352 [Corchorus olitorius]|uniref:Uncharacterized protein n=1 Tax=Corchorus olitorius TaxID=93759 RepID=A0A1R3G9G3_9ROSI|nr:hypothetical protein COLO4_36352 [Corchorus olitorius]